MLRVKGVVFAALLGVAIRPPALADLNPEAGSFLVQNYSPKSYDGLPETWAIAQDFRGIMYFGNAVGVLEFSGGTDPAAWRHIPLDNHQTVRSLAVDAKGTVFVGGQQTFGYLRPDETKTMHYVSLVSKVPGSERKFGDVYDVVVSPAGVYFRSRMRLFLYTPEGQIKSWTPKTAFLRAFSFGGDTYVYEDNEGFFKISGGRLVPSFGRQHFPENKVAAIAQNGETAILASGTRLYTIYGNYILPFPTQADAYLEENQIYSLRRLPDGEIGVGTRRGGLVILNSRGDLIRILTHKSGLPSDYITGLYSDYQGGIWVSTVVGLARFELGLTRFGEPQGLGGAVQIVKRLGGHLYVGSNNGLFVLRTVPGSEAVFDAVPSLRQTVWDLAQASRELIVAAQDGVYTLVNGKATRVLEADLVYELDSSPQDPDIVYAASRSGVFMLRRGKKSWEVGEHIPANGSVFRTVAEDSDGRVWATTKTDIRRFDFRSKPVKTEVFGDAQGVPDSWKNVWRFRGHIVFATSKGLMRFSEADRKFVPDEELGREFADGTRAVSLLREDPRGNVWITGQGYHGVLARGNNGLVWNPMPLVQSGMEEAYAFAFDPDGTCWASGGDGILHRWDPALQGSPSKGFHVMIRRLGLEDRSNNVYGGAGSFPKDLRIPFRENAVRFEYVAPFYQDQTGVQYQVRLGGSDKDWSPWTNEVKRDFTNLPEHFYTFYVRARNARGVISPVTTFSFTVLAPWYRSWWAYSLYLLSVVFAGWMVVRWRVRILEAQNRRLEQIVEERTVEVRNERDQNERLLLNILPAPVAEELRGTGAVTPMSFDDVTVCFTDFVGFTLSSEQLAADKLVTALNDYFTAFDEIVGRYGLEKLKTIGDSYMFVSGLPERRPSHAVDAVLAALEMVEAVRKLAKPGSPVDWKVRVGLFSGPVVAGVVGKKKFAFDIWGNTVNFAARMESSGAPNRVNLSKVTWERVRDFIECQPRGMVRIKEGREMEMFFAVGPREDLTAGELVDGVPAMFREKYLQAYSDLPKAFPELIYSLYR